MVARHKVLANGGRQIISLHIPGDMPDLHSLFVDRMDHSLSAIAPARIMAIPHAVIRKVLRTHQVLCEISWRDTLIDAAIFRERLISLGRRSARAGIAHFFCETMTRMKAVGLTEGHTCGFPLTQEDIGDVTGFSAVHVNRTLQELRAEGLIEIGQGSLTVLEWRRLAEVGEFDPAYLHQPSETPPSSAIGGDALDC